MLRSFEKTWSCIWSKIWMGKSKFLSQLMEAKQEDDWSFRRSKWFNCMEKECKNVRENVGLLDMTAFAKCFELKVLRQKSF